jgi:serine/threonine protein kinase
MGSMAEVWRADVPDDPAAGNVALKCLLPHLREWPDRRKRFLTEAEISARLAHPNVVRLLDVGEHERLGPFIVMEWIDGPSLRHVLDVYVAANRPVPPAVATAVALGLLAALGAAHGLMGTDRHGNLVPTPVVHRDVSPANVLLSSRGEVKLGDFGLAHALDADEHTPHSNQRGKLDYLAPERVRGATATPASDLYSAGVVLWEMLAGRPLYDKMNDAQIMSAVVARWRPPPLGPLRPSLPPELCAAVDRAIACEPTERFESAAAMTDAIGDALAEISGTVEPAAVAGAVALACKAPEPEKPRLRTVEFDLPSMSSLVVPPKRRKR